MNRHLFRVAVCLFVAAWSLPAQADEEAIQKMVAVYVESFNSQDIEAVANLWAEDGVHTDRSTGAQTEGREAIKADIAIVFKERPETKLAGRVDRVRMIKSDVASVEGETSVGAAGEDPVHSSFTAIVINNDGKWLIHSIDESPLPTPETSYDALSDLDWLVGQWVDQGEESRVDTTIRWTESRSFLLRSFVSHDEAGVAQQGTQIIGWDPRAKQIRSWSFGSDGSFGDGVWSKNGDEWLIKSSQTLADGRAASGTFVLSKVDDDTISLQLVGHEIEGEPQPSRDAVTVVRAPPETEAQQSEAAPASAETSDKKE